MENFMGRCFARLDRWIRRYRVVVFFLLGLFGVDRLIDARRDSWRAYDPQMYRDHPVNCQRESPDLVVIGGSTAMSGLDPARLVNLPWRGQRLESAYNFGLPLATVAEVFHAAEHGLACPPRLLVYGICASDFNEDRVEPLGPSYLMDGRDFWRWYGLRGPQATWWSLRKFIEERASRQWSLWYYRQPIRLWVADRVDRIWPGSCSASAAEARERLLFSRALRQRHGFVESPDRGSGPRLDRLKASGASLLPFPFLENYSLGNYRVYLDWLLDWADARGITIVLVDMPVSADLETHYATGFAGYRKWLHDVECCRDVPVLRPTRRTLGLEDKHFYDLIHLNYDGAALLTTWLRKELIELGMPTGERTRTEKVP